MGSVYWSSLLIAALLVPAATVFAVNPLFMPGDAFFHSLLTEASLEKSTPNVIELSYDFPVKTMAFCGYCGFSKLEIRGDTRSLSDGLKKIHASIRKEWPVDIRVYGDGRKAELNPFHLFVYNRGADWKSNSFRLAVRYNEGWREPPPEAFEGVKDQMAKLSRERVRYTTFIDSADAVINDWQFGARFDALRVRVPKGEPWAVHGKPIENPVEADAADIQLVVTDSDELAPYFNREHKYSLYVITNDATTGYQFGESGKLEELNPTGD